MINAIIPKLPMRNKNITANFYIKELGFKFFGTFDFDGYLMLTKDNLQLHFFEFKDLNPDENYGQIYLRTTDIDSFYKQLLANGTIIHPQGKLQIKPWGQKEFSLLDPDKNLLTFGEETKTS